MAKPYYFQTEDEKRMAAIRANPSGRPMLPSNYDATEVERWGKNEFGQSKIPMERYMENSRKMRPVEEVPTAGDKPASKKYQPAPGDFAYAYRDTSTPFPNAYPGLSLAQAENETIARGEDFKAYKDMGYKPESALPRWGMGTPIAQRGVKEVQKPPNPYGPGTAPTPQDIAEMEKAGTADTLKKAGTADTLDAWQSGLLAPIIDKTEPWGTALNDRPEGGRSYENFRPGGGRSFENLSRPMGMGALSQRPTSTAPGASERVAARRAIIMDPKSTEVARRFAKRIGGASNNDSWAP